MEKKTLIIIIAIVVFAFILGYIVGVSERTKTSSFSSTETSQKDSKPVKETEPININIGQKISNSDIEMTLTGASIKEEIKWSTSSYSSRSAYLEDGKVAATFYGEFKNLRSEEIRDYALEGKLIVDDKYEYELSFAPHISSSSITPLENVEYDFYAQLPKDIQNSYSKLEFIFGYNNDFKMITTEYINGEKQDKIKTLDNVFSLVVTK